MSALFCAMLLGLSACGGGGGDSGGGFIPSTPGGDLLSYTVTLSIVDADGNPTSIVTDISPATLRILVREDNLDAAPVEGVVAAATATTPGFEDDGEDLRICYSKGIQGFCSLLPF